MHSSKLYIQIAKKTSTHPPNFNINKLMARVLTISKPCCFHKHTEQYKGFTLY